MDLTDAKKQSVIFYLGWPAKSIIETSNIYNSGTSDRLKNLTAPIISRVDDLLGKLENTDKKLEAAACRLSAKKVDDIETNPEEIAMLKKERRRLSRELASLLDIPYLGCSVNVSVCR